MEYVNVFEKIGYGKEITDERLDLIFEMLFYSEEDVRIYH